MRSPFPGMDPYLEEPGGWAGAHDALIAIMRELLNGQLGPNFIADGGTSVYVLTPDERRWIYPDVFVIETPAVVAAPATRGAIAAPLRVAVAAPETIEQPHIIIRDRASRQVIAVLELLSPINKVPEGVSYARQSSPRADFLAEASRDDAVADSLAGDRPPARRRAPARSARAWRLLRAAPPCWQRRGRNLADRSPRSPADDRRAVEPWLRRCCPRPSSGAGLALRAVSLRRTARLHRTSPPPPPFAPSDARWIAERVQQWQAARVVASSAA